MKLFKAFLTGLLMLALIAGLGGCKKINEDNGDSENEDNEHENIEEAAEEVEKTDKTMEVSNPTADKVISSPLLVKGKATGTWFFEGTFPIELLDENGELIASGTVQALGEWTTPDFVEFEGDLEFETDSEVGSLVLKNSNPSGLPENQMSFEIPVKFKQPSTQAATSDSAKLVQDYVKENLNEINPVEAVLGGSWYMLGMSAKADSKTSGSINVVSEDGHIQSEFSANYEIVDGEVQLSKITQLSP